MSMTPRGGWLLWLLNGAQVLLLAALLAFVVLLAIGAAIS